MIEGTITPPIENVRIIAKSNNGHEHYSYVQNDGKYRLGPVLDLKYEITAVLEDYRFEL